MPSPTSLPATSLLPALPLTQTSPQTYTTTLSSLFTIGTVPHGGYITAFFLQVSATHFQTTLQSQSQPDPSILHLNFLRRTSAGPATFVVKNVKLGRATSIIHITLQQDGVDEVVAYITHMNFSAQSGISLDSGWKLAPPSPGGTPATKFNGLWEEVKVLPYMTFRKATAHVELWMPRSRKGMPAGRVDQWVRMRSGERWTATHLGYLADYFPRLIEFMESDQADATTGTGETIGAGEGDVKKREKKAGFWYPTLVLNLEIKKRLPPQGCEWLRTVAVMKTVKNGRNDLEVYIFDEGGDLVAISYHVCLVVGVERNVGERRKERVNKI